MATISANLKMTLPEAFDKVDVGVLSDNFSTIDSAFDQVVGKESVANNLTTTEEGKTLDARQGRELATQIQNIDKAKVNNADVINNLTTNDSKKPLSAAQGFVLMELLNGKISMSMTAVLLESGKWSNNKQTVTVNGLVADESKMAVIAQSAPANHVYYNECDIRCVAQGNNSLTFECTNIPSSNLTANVLILS